MRTGCILMVMPRSRSRSMLSNTWSRILRASIVLVTSRKRSASVDLPWSICAIIEKLRICITRTIYHNTLDTTAANAVVVAGGTADVKNNIGPSTTNNLATSDTFYVAKAQGNYQLVVGTAPVNAGLDLTATVPTDIIGVSRILQAPPDLGAYEYEPIAQGGGGGIATVSQTEISTPWVSVRPGVANSRNITLTNTGSAVLNIASIAISGNTKNFSQTNNCGATLAADVSCTITITFVAHNATTVTQGVLTVDTDALDPTVTLDGTGITIPPASRPGAN